jgi:hypothetical protein
VHWASFFHKAPEFIELHRLEVEINHQIAGDGFDVLGCSVQPGRDCVFVDFLDPSRCPDAVAFGQAGDHIVEKFFVCFQIKQGSTTTRGKPAPTYFAFQKLCVLFSIGAGANDLVVGSYLAIVGAVFVRTEVHAGIDLLLAAHSRPPLSHRF